MRKKRIYKKKADGWDKNHHSFDDYFKDLVDAGRLLVTKDGVITNPKTGNKLGNYKDPKRYSIIGFSENGGIKHISAHRLIWIVFVGPTGSMVINHKNGIKNDNRLENLELITETENNRHAYRTGLNISSRYAVIESRKRMIQNNPTPDKKDWSEDDIREIRKLSTPYIRGRDKILAKKYKCSRKLISLIRRRKLYTWVK
jgi:hypothetical protein